VIKTQTGGIIKLDREINMERSTEPEDKPCRQILIATDGSLKILKQRSEKLPET